MAMIFAIFLLLLLLFGPVLAAIALYFSLSISWHLVLLGVCILVYGTVPFMIGGIGLRLAKRFDCQSTGISYTCPANPQMGELVTQMVFIGAWGILMVLPSALLGCIGLIISAFIKASSLV